MMNSMRRFLISCSFFSAASFAAASLAAAAPVELYLSPEGADANPGTAEKPFRTLHRAQEAARQAIPTLDGELIVNLLPGEYRLDKPLEFTQADSGRNGFRVTYRSAGGLGQARILGSLPLVGWQPHGDGIWKIAVPEGMRFHTLYENGRRAWKARFPNYEHHPDMPTARGRYLVSVDGSPQPAADKRESTSWLVYGPEDAPPVTAPATMDILLFAEGKCDWMRTLRKVVAIDPEQRRITIAGSFWMGVKAQARFFLENELGFLDAPGEFYLDAAEHTLYYKPLGEGHPDSLGIAAPVLGRLIQFQGASREQCVENVSLVGLMLAETDDAPQAGWWATQYGRLDGALVWMSNARNVEIRDCHLKNSGRSGIMMIGQNTENLVTGCWIEHLGVNGVTLCNRFSGPDKAQATADRCERNRVLNCRIHHVGEIHCYAACVNAFNVSDNEVGYCELSDSVRYAVTIRGNSGEQYGPLVFEANLPFCRGNRFHHLCICRCGQDSGDMGALHAANLNIPGGDAVNTFEQITVADCRAIPSMKDIGPDGIFLDWPQMAMHQIFRNVQIVRMQGQQLRSHRPENGASAATENVSWEPDFDASRMEYDTIGLRPDFPQEYGSASPAQLPPPAGLQAKPLGSDRVQLSWQSAVAEGQPSVLYMVYRDGVPVATTTSTSLEDHGLTERTVYRYAVAARVREFAPAGPRSPECEVRTPADTTPLLLRGVLAGDHAEHVWVRFSKPVDPATAGMAANYQIDQGIQILEAKPQAVPALVRLRTTPLAPGTTYRLTVRSVTDTAAARNPVAPDSQVTFRADRMVLHYTMDMRDGETVVDASGNHRHAHLKGHATWAPDGGRIGGALLLDGKDAYAEGPADFELGRADFTLAAWIWKDHDTNMIVLAKADGFKKHEWSWGWTPCCFRAENHLTFHPEPADLGAQRWMHVAFVRRGSQGQAYVDGRPSGGEHDLSVLGDLTNGQPLLIGRRRHEETPIWFQGRIDDVRIYDRALTADEMAVLAALR